jgi:hypothetical protein
MGSGNQAIEMSLKQPQVEVVVIEEIKEDNEIMIQDD